MILFLLPNRLPSILMFCIGELSDVLFEKKLRTGSSPKRALLVAVSSIVELFLLSTAKFAQLALPDT